MAIQNNNNSTIININLPVLPESVLPAPILPRRTAEHRGLLPGDYDCESLDDDGDIESGDSSNKSSISNRIDKLPLPNFFKSFLKSLVSDSGNTGNRLPSASDAARSMRDFQKQNNISVLSRANVKQMADTGFCTLPGDRIIPVSPDVRRAAQKMMENNGALFKKLESSSRGSEDGLLSKKDYDDLLKNGSIGKQCSTDLPMVRGLDMWRTFLMFVANGSLGSIRPAEYEAAKTIRDFQKQHNIDLLSRDQVKQMADTGYCTLPRRRFKVPPNVRRSMRQMMANNGDLYRRMETSIRVKPDSLLSAADFDAAVKNGSIDQAHTGGYAYS